MSTHTNSIRIDAGVEMSFRIGQRVRHHDYKGQRVTGVVKSLSIESEQGLMVSIALDSPTVIPAGDGFAAINLYSQHAPAHEFSPFDERDDVVAELQRERDELLKHLRLAVDHIGALNGALGDLASLGATVAICGVEYDDGAARAAIAMTTATGSST